MKQVKVTNSTRELKMPIRARLAGGYLERLRGLLGCPPLECGEGLLLRPCSSVHTWFMGYPLDLVFLDGDGHVLRTVVSLPPFRFALGPKGTRSILELPAGAVEASGIQPGDTLALAVS